MKRNFVLNCCTQIQAMKLFLYSKTNQNAWAVKNKKEKYINNLQRTETHWLCPSCNYNLKAPARQFIFFKKSFLFQLVFATTNINKLHWAGNSERRHKIILIKPVMSLSKLSDTSRVTFLTVHIQGKDHCTLLPSPSMLCAIQQDVLSGSECWQSPRLLMFTHKHSLHQRSLFDV